MSQVKQVPGGNPYPVLLVNHNGGQIPADVQATVRASEAGRFCFLLNFTNESKAVAFNKPTFDLLEERELRGTAEVPPYGVRFVRL